MLWVILHDVKRVRLDPRASQRHAVTERWWLCDRDVVERFEVTYDPHDPPKPEDMVPSVGVKIHGLGVVPVVDMVLPKGLWIANRIASSQKESFRLGNANNWSIRQTCYAMPVFHLEPDAKPPVMGAGYYVKMGITEKASWLAPPTDHIETVRREVGAQKD